jgi:hypothetical protein
MMDQQKSTPIPNPPANGVEMEAQPSKQTLSRDEMKILKQLKKDEVGSRIFSSLSQSINNLL